ERLRASRTSARALFRRAVGGKELTLRHLPICRVVIEGLPLGHASNWLSLVAYLQVLIRLVGPDGGRHKKPRAQPAGRPEQPLRHYLFCHQNSPRQRKTER